MLNVPIFVKIVHSSEWQSQKLKIPMIVINQELFKITSFKVTKQIIIATCLLILSTRNRKPISQENFN